MKPHKKEYVNWYKDKSVSVEKSNSKRADAGVTDDAHADLTAAITLKKENLHRG